MMIITDGNGAQHEWHVGEPLPVFQGRIVRLQADGHELEWLKIALEAGAAMADQDYYATVWGTVFTRVASDKQQKL